MVNVDFNVDFSRNSTFNLELDFPLIEYLNKPVKAFFILQLLGAKVLYDMKR